MNTSPGHSFFQSLFKHSSIVNKLTLIHDRLSHVEDLLEHLDVNLLTLKNATRGYVYDYRHNPAIDKTLDASVVDELWEFATSSESEKVEIIKRPDGYYQYTVVPENLFDKPSRNGTTYDKDAFKIALNEYAIKHPGAKLISFDLHSDPKHAASKIMSRWMKILEETKPRQFDRKSTLPENFHLFEKSLLAISKIHNFGDDKYGRFSWVNAEASSCATLESTIGSLTSHFLMIFTNQERDAETDALHYEHLVTRCQMGIHKLYRQLNPNAFTDEHKEDNSSIVKEVISLSCTEDTSKYREQITLTTLLSLNKFDTKLTKLTEVELRDVMMECLLILLEGYKETSNDIWNKIYILDIFFWCACLSYKKIECKSGTLSDHSSDPNSPHKYSFTIPGTGL